MSRSENGWPAPPPAASLKRIEVPGTKRGFTLRSDIAPLLLYVARRVDAEVARIDTGTWDDWAYATPVPIPGSRVISNHGSGTALDLNATLWPWKRLTMRLAQRRKVRAIVRACGGQVRWGGDYRSSVDEMHFELAPGTTVASVRAQIKRMRLRGDGTVKPKPVYPTLTRTLKVGMRGADVRAWRKVIGQRTTGPTGDKFTAVTARKTRKWRKAHGLGAGPGAVGPAAARKAGWHVKT